MLIGKFNRYFEKHGRATLLFILVVISVPFVIAFGPEWYAVQEGSLFGNARVGWVAGRSFDQAELMRQFHAIELYQSVFQGRGLIDLRPGNAAMRQLGPQALNRLRALSEARRLGIDAVSDQEVADELRRIFTNADGQFDRENFRNFKENYLSQRRLTGQDLDQIVRDNLIIERLGRRGSALLPSTRMQDKLDTLDGHRQALVQVATYRGADHLADMTVTDAEAKDWFEGQRDRYRAPEQRKLVVAVFQGGDYRPGVKPVTEADITDHYEAHKDAKYSEKLARLSHILLATTPEDGDEAIAAKKAKLEELRKDAAEKQNFAELAALHSQDADSKAQGGDLGFLRSRDRGPVGRAGVSLKLGELSQVITSGEGLHLILKTEEKSQSRPLAEVRTLIERELRTVKEREVLAELARPRYDERLESRYRGSQVTARHILIKVPEGASAEEQALREELAKNVRELAVGGKDFAELAKEYSEDTGSKDKGGDVGTFGPGKMVEPFYQAAKALAPNAISEPVKTQFGYHIIQTLKVEDLPFDRARGEIEAEIRAEWEREGRDTMRQAAHAFAVQVYRQTDGKSHAESLLTFRGLAAGFQPAPRVVESGFFAADARAVPGVPGNSADLVSRVQVLSMRDPLGDLVEKDNTFYVPHLVEIRPSTLPELSAVRARVDLDARLEKGAAKAREQARADYAAIKGAMDAERPFAEARGAVAFVPVGPFDLRQGPQHEERQLIMELVGQTPAGTLTAPRDIQGGALMLFVETQEFPAADALDSPMMGMAAMPNWADMMRAWQQRQAFEQKLSDRVAVQLVPVWHDVLQGQD